MVSRLEYSMSRGLLWERLVIIKNRRTRRVIRPAQARCVVKVGDIKKSIPTSLTKEGGVLLRLEPEDTLDFPVGVYEFDIVAPIRDYWQPVAKGTLTVTALDNISPLQDGQQMEVRFKKGEDYRNTFSWYDSEGNLESVTDAYMQAKNSSGTVVIDLRWFATAPNEATIAALPATRRGYLAPYPGETMEMHISELNSVTAGEYPFDIFVKNADGDWKFLSGGYVVVEASVSTRPT